MESQKLFPKESRLNKALNKPNGYGVDSFQKIIDWIKLYHDALLVAEKELVDLGAKIIYSRNCLPEKERMIGGMSISGGKFGYYPLVTTLKLYKFALKTAEKQIEKINQTKNK